MSRTKALVTLGVMLSLFMASMEATVVATAMPTIVGQLGGLESYAWVFSAYLLAATTTIPIYGKLSDVYGRRPIFTAAMVLFLVGSVLCGLAGSMGELIGFRTIQGLGAGGILPLAFTIVGALFTYEQRARMQGIFSGVWGLSSIVGPVLGGFLVDQVSWRWVFWVNIIPGLLAWALIWRFWIDQPRAKGEVNVDYAGAAVLSAVVIALLLGLFELGSPRAWLFLAVSGVLFIVLMRVEQRAADPVLPLAFFRDRLFAAASGHGALSGWAMFGSIAFVPLFVQAVLRTSATNAGATLMPLMLGWVAASVVSSRLLLRFTYRALALVGMVSLTAGTLLMASINAQTTRFMLMTYLSLMGIGMGMSIPAFLIAVQTSVPPRTLGIATSTLQFTRSIGGVLGVSVMGAVLVRTVASRLAEAGADPQVLSVSSLLDPIARAPGNVSVASAMGEALVSGIHAVFLIAFAAAGLGLVVTAMAPRGHLRELAESRSRETAGTGKS